MMTPKDPTGDDRSEQTNPNREDQRKHLRTDLIFKIEYKSPRDFLADYTANASGGGVFIATKNSFQVGDRISFSISFPGLVSPILCTGEVRWKRSPEEITTEEAPQGIGVAFLFDSGEDSSRLKKFLQELAPETPTEVTQAIPSEKLEIPFRVLLLGHKKSVLRMFPFALDKSSAIGHPSKRKLVVEEVADSAEAWNRLLSEPFDLLVTEFHLPLSNCQELIQKIRAHERTQKLPVIVVGEDSDEAQQAAFSAKADMFLGTPINLVQLFRSLQALLRLDIKD